jgi:NAD(P)-dependent dehydrogenase (short-subunit alcohol dehydrogenase family)
VTAGTVVVTGASSGIGAATVALPTRRSWTVIGVDLRPPKPRDVHWVTGDVSDRSVPRQAREAGEAHGPLVGWVNCAGIPFASSLLDVDAELVHKVVAVDQLAYFWGGVEAATPFIESGHSGSIVNISSIHGVRGLHGWSGPRGRRRGTRSGHICVRRDARVGSVRAAGGGSTTGPGSADVGVSSLARLLVGEGPPV